MENNDPSSLRKVYFDAWQKEQEKLPLSPLEAMIVDVIQRHPEYHPIFDDPKNFHSLQDEKFQLDHNPFFHLALHVTVLEQISANRPGGIRKLYQQLLKKIGDRTETEHKIMACLANVLKYSFERDEAANEQLYLKAIRRLL
ncbi:DUF1841 family protein [Candidatus Berkiella aquae]|uniref:DUF1841 family protein n=1 Tax=Candidatus Berkiella aquae TaxID=295108 RepID=A0A0Q9YL23_9GAMM|nr:DUF1841 family protein [Candidatus Berkiella aquae]MCS5710959.1 DUF1841 family protein [Candidatus Berkiella aquae]